MTDSEPRVKSLLAVLLGAVDRHVKQRPRDTIVRNAVDDPAEVYAQRVTENDACDFCSRFANDAPVDPSRVSEKFHQFCKCHFMLFFQETKYRDRFVSDEELKKVGIAMEPGADPDYYEKRDAMVLAALGRKVRFLKRHPSGARRADTLIDGELVEFKNPEGNGLFTVTYQIQGNLYGTNKAVMKPQSDVLLISNVRNSMTMAEMQESLAFAFGPDSLLTAEEKAYMRKIVLLDERTRRVRVYEMKDADVAKLLGRSRRQVDNSIASRVMQSDGSVRSGDRFLRTDSQPGLLGYGMRNHPEKYDGQAEESSLNHGRWKSDERKQRTRNIKMAITCVHPVFISPRGNETLVANIKRIKHREGYYDIHAHGSVYTIECFGSDVGAEDLAYILSQRDDYHGEPIRLFACHAGEKDENGDCFAARLAAIMKIEVEAAPDVTRIRSDGSFCFGDPDVTDFEVFDGRL